MDAVLLSAGLGRRMIPITDYVPKPLLPVVDFRLIDYNIIRLFRSGVDNIAINLFHMAESIERYLDRYPQNLHIVTERTLKGTGGALLNFKKIVQSDFIFYSCDALTDIDLTRVVEFHQNHKPAATLVLLKRGNENIIHIDDEHRVKKIASISSVNAYDFAGVAVFSDRIFSYLPDKEKFSIVEVWERMLENSELLLGYPLEVNWYNINSPRVYWQVHYDLLVNNITLGGHHYGSSVYVDPTSQVKAKKINGFVSIGPNCRISDQVSMTNTVVFGNSTIEQGDYINCLLSDKYCIEIDR
ncbi:MAG: NDP-sugar synthase [bacterium]